MKFIFKLIALLLFSLPFMVAMDAPIAIDVKAAFSLGAIGFALLAIPQIYSFTVLSLVGWFIIVASSLAITQYEGAARLIIFLFYGLGMYIANLSFDVEVTSD